MIKCAGIYVEYIFGNRCHIYHIHQVISAAINARPTPDRVRVPTFATILKEALTTAFDTVPFAKPPTIAAPAAIPVASKKQSLKDPPLVVLDPPSIFHNLFYLYWFLQNKLIFFKLAKESNEI